MGDFGLSRKTEEGYYTSESKTMPVKWCSPEVLRYGKYSTKVNTTTTIDSIISFVCNISYPVTISIYIYIYIERCMVVWGGVVGII